MNNNEKGKTFIRKTIDSDSIEDGMIFAGFIEVPEKFKILDGRNIDFIQKYGFKEIKVIRNGDIKLINSSELMIGDEMLEMGRLNRYIRISNAIRTRQYFKLYGFTKLRVLMDREQADKLLEKENKVEEPIIETPVEPEPIPAPRASTTPQKRNAQFIANSINHLQENIDKSEAVMERGHAVLVDLFRSGNFQNFKLESIEEVAKDLDKVVTENPQSYNALTLLKDHDEYTYRHCVDVANQMLMTLKYMYGNERGDLKEIGVGALLHDVGKSKVPIEIINKPGKLTEEEWKFMRMHPVYSAEIMTQMGLSKMQIDIGLKHHVRKNGTGYPSHVTYDDTSEIDRICSISDVFQALITKRPYKITDTPIQAFRKIRQWTETDFDYRLVEIFIKAFGIFPPGSLIKLSDNRYAFVVVTGKNSLRPVVAVVINQQRMVMENPEIIDLEKPDYDELKIAEAANHRNFFTEDEALELFLKLT